MGLRLKLAPDCRVCVCSLRPGQQAAAAYLCRARTGGQNLRLLAVPAKVFLPDRVAGECVSLCAPTAALLTSWRSLCQPGYSWGSLQKEAEPGAGDSSSSPSCSPLRSSDRICLGLALWSVWLLQPEFSSAQTIGI